MIATVTPSQSPYVGPRPFERGDEAFFGRDGEVLELVSLVVAHRLVLLYAASGAGKTSLINAGLIPALEEQESFEIIPVARLRPFDPELTAQPGLRNIYTFGVTSNWSREVVGSEYEADLSLSLAAALARWEHSTDSQGLARPRAVVFDQFEELFTLFPERWPDRADFLTEVADALDQDPLLRVVFALREDYLAQLDAHAALLPGHLRTRLRIERLGPDAAEAAITGPLQTTSRTFAPGVARKLVSDLRRIRVDSSFGEQTAVEGEFVEPVHLQVVCQSLWADLPPNVTTITESHLRTFGNLDEVLSRFYDGAVYQAASAAAMKERRLRQALEEAFLTAGGTRGTVYRGASATGGIPNRAIDELENSHVLRGEWRAGARWYELTHDRLVEPIQSSNAVFAATRARRRNRRALGASAVVATLSVTGVVVAALIAGGSESYPTADSATARCVGCQARLISAALTPDMTFAEYLRDVEQSPAGFSPRRLRRKGVLTQYAVTIRNPSGARHDFSVSAAVVNAASGDVLSSTHPQTLRVASRQFATSSVVWLPTPQLAGRYVVSLQISAPGAAALALDTIKTAPFSGLDGDQPKVTVAFHIRKSGTGTGRVVSSPSGLDCGTRCSISVGFGARITLSATPEPGSRFAGWTGACGHAPTCTIAVGPITAIGARFVAR